MDEFLASLKPLADGKTTVPMASHVNEFVLGAECKVSSYNTLQDGWQLAELRLKCSLNSMVYISRQSYYSVLFKIHLNLNSLSC